MSDAESNDDHQLAALEPAHVAAFRAFRRAPERADRQLASEPTAAGHLSPSLNPKLARCVYSGERGRIYIVPGPGSLGSVSIAAATGETVIGQTTTELAALSGLGHVLSGTDRPTTFIGVLPAGAHDLRIIDQDASEIRVQLTRDGAYWITVTDPVDIVWTAADGDDHHPPFSRHEI